MRECKAVVTVMLIMFASVQYRPIMLGELSTNGNFSALLVHQIAKAWKLKLNAQVHVNGKWSIQSLRIDHCSNY